MATDPTDDKTLTLVHCDKVDSEASRTKLETLSAKVRDAFNALEDARVQVQAYGAAIEAAGERRDFALKEYTRLKNEFFDFVLKGEQVGDARPSRQKPAPLA